MKHLFMTRQKSVRWVSFAQLFILLGIFLGLPGITRAEEIAILKSADISAYSEAIDAFKAALPASSKVTLEYDLHGDMAKGRSLARRIRASDTKVVLAVGLKAALAAKLEIIDIPVVFCLVLDPKKYGLPTGNMIGLSLEIPFRKQLKPLQTLIPKVSKIGVLYDPQKTQGMRDRLQQQAKSLGITLLSEEVHSEQDLSMALKSLGERIDALWLIPDSTVLSEDSLDFLISTTLEANIPVVGFSAGLVQSGALVGVHFNYADLGKQAGRLSQDLLGENSSHMLGTMVPPEDVHQSINQKSAEYLGLPLPSQILRQFDEQY